MTTLLLHHPVFTLHAPPPGHPERPDRMRAIEKVLAHPLFSDLERREAERAASDDILLVHPESRSAVDRSQGSRTGRHGRARSRHLDVAGQASKRPCAASAPRYRGVDAVFERRGRQCLLRRAPARPSCRTRRAMGFCLFNNVAIAAHHARVRHDAERVAVVDFDVHHGNGTQDIFWSDARPLLRLDASDAALSRAPARSRKPASAISSMRRLRAGDGSKRFRDAMEADHSPALDAFRPDLVLISAGFRCASQRSARRPRA